MSDPYGISCNAEGLPPDGANVVRFQSNGVEAATKSRPWGQIMVGEIRAALSGCGGMWHSQRAAGRPTNQRQSSPRRHLSRRDRVKPANPFCADRPRLLHDGPAHGRAVDDTH
jgi:hypothetical protein